MTQSEDERQWSTQLFNIIDPLPFPPTDLSVETFARILGTRGSFSYSFVGADGSFLSHLGTATLIDTSTVPEPASLVFLGTGLSALATRQYLNRRRRVSEKEGAHVTR